MNYIDQIAEAIFATSMRVTRGEDAEPVAWASVKAMHPLYRIYALLALTVGTVMLEDVHNAWSTWVATMNPAHVRLVPFSDLRPEVQALDRPYALAIDRVVVEHPEWFPNR